MNLKERMQRNFDKNEVKEKIWAWINKDTQIYFEGEKKGKVCYNITQKPQFNFQGVKKPLIHENQISQNGCFHLILVQLEQKSYPRGFDKTRTKTWFIINIISFILHLWLVVFSKVMFPDLIWMDRTIVEIRPFSSINPLRLPSTVLLNNNFNFKLF